MTLLRISLALRIVAILSARIDSLLWFSPCGNGLRNGKMFAKKLIQPTIAVAIDMLTDDNDNNDLQAWNILSHALVASGDILNATAALLMISNSRN
jgi:hypothetical protein